ncbi:MAG: polymerase [Gaiellales bacterium]|nr:polymerase [Gaiellales bacterium]
MRGVPLSNGEIAQLIDLLGDLYEIDGAVVYRVLAYRKAAASMRETPESVWRLSEEGKLTQLDGIGDTIAAKVRELRETGTLVSLEKLRAKLPESLVEIKRLPGVGAKTAKRIYDELGISTIAELEAAATAGTLRGHAGIAEKKEQAILEAIAAGAGSRKTVIILERALRLSGSILEGLRAQQTCVRASEAGSLRRRVEVVGDIDLIAASDDAGALIGWFCEQEIAAQVVGRGETKGSIITNDGVQVDLRVVPPAAFGNLLQHFTGSKAHNVAMREDAVKRGLKVSEWGIENVETGAVFQTGEEDEVYRHLGYVPVPPEIREGTVELARARAGTLPALIEFGDVRGDLHVHTNVSDGKATLIEMVEAARASGLDYLAITDHSAGVGMGIGLEPDALPRHLESIRELAASLDDFTLLAGVEVDVMVDGSLYYDDDLLSQVDWVVASLHVGQRQDSARATRRMLSAIENPYVDVLAHPSGRLLGRREGYEFDVQAVAEAAARTGTFLEINCGPNRLDLRPAHAKAAIEAGVKLVISTDAHRTTSFAHRALGVAMARRAWATADDIANTRPWAELDRLRKQR